MTGSQASDVLVSFRGVQKSYDGENLIVKDLNLDIRKGEFLTLLGPSGSGKTTSLMMLAGFETPTAGEILLDGRAINNVPPHKRDMGMVFQNYALFPHMTVSENLAFPLSVRGMAKPDIKERVKRAGDGATGGLSQSLSGAAFRRPAAARGPGPRPGFRAAAGADGRTPGRPRQAAARAYADGDQAPAPASRRDRGLRHP
jgi:putative spermidine/putrescine transport system ATP-binding protein